MSLDVLMSERYDREENNCLHFAAKAWALLTGDERLHGIREGDRVAQRGIMRFYAKVAGPTIEPSVALMNDRDGRYHMGICFRRRLLHLTDMGAVSIPFDVVNSLYRNLRFYQ